MKTQALALFFVAASIFRCNAADTNGCNLTVVPEGHRTSLHSPDHKFTALTEGGNISISATGGHTHTHTHRHFPLIEVIPPVLALMWSSDSKTLVSVEHLAMITDVNLNHFDGTHWTRFEADPIKFAPIYKYVLVKLRAGKDTVHASFTGQDDHGELYYVEFDVRPSDNSYHHAITRKLSDKEYGAMHVMQFD